MIKNLFRIDDFWDFLAVLAILISFVYVIGIAFFNLVPSKATLIVSFGLLFLNFTLAKLDLEEMVKEEDEQGE